VLPLAIWYSGAPLAVALVGVFAYRVLALWLPLPASLAFLPTLRAMGERRIAAGGLVAGKPAERTEPGLRHSA
jgi:hypothetical protein